MPKAQCPKPLSWEKIQESGRAQYSGMRTGVNGRRGHAGQVTAMQAQGAGLKKPRVEREAGSGVRGWWMVGGGWCVETNGGRLRKRAVACHSLAQSNPKSKIQNPKSGVPLDTRDLGDPSPERACWLVKPDCGAHAESFRARARNSAKLQFYPTGRVGVPIGALAPGFSRVEDVARPLL